MKERQSCRHADNPTARMNRRDPARSLARTRNDGDFTGLFALFAESFPV
jgi:hypothetical protein